MTFEEKHAQVDDDPLVKLKRRLQPWASAPPSRGASLDAAIVPRSTIEGAILMLEEQRKLIDMAKRAKTKGTA